MLPSTIAESWVVEVFGLASESEWDQITRSSRTAGITLFLAFVLWELFKYATDPYMERKTKSLPRRSPTAMRPARRRRASAP